MLLFDTGKRLEKAVGEEAACIIMQVFEQYDENAKQELATKGDLHETELRLQADIRQTELRLQSEMQKMKVELIKWQIGGLISLAAIMAKGFGWLGF